MQSIETILAIGAFVLLTIFTLTLNSNIVQEQATMYQGSQLFEAIGVAQGYIEEAEFLEYDDQKAASARNSFTPYDELGPEGESYGEFDDIDDFNNYTIIDTLLSNAHYNANCRVFYVDEDDLVTKVNHRTWLKRVEVKVWNSFQADTLAQSVIVSYWKFL